LDWLYEHDPMTLFAGIALQARQRFGIKAQHLHIYTTSFSVNGEYLAGEQVSDELMEQGDAVPIAITYGYSRDHSSDLKQWMLGLATSHDGDIPVFLRLLDGNSSDKESISAIVTTVMTQLRETLSEEVSVSLCLTAVGTVNRTSPSIIRQESGGSVVFQKPLRRRKPLSKRKP
jgi:transposase